MKSLLSWVGLVLLAGWAVLSLVLAIWNTFTPLGGNDLYTYWYAGLFIRQGEDPYAAFIAHQQPDLPITFLDGEADSIDDIKIPGLVPAPANTYPLVYLLTLFSFLTWPSAKVAWLICNLVLVFIVPLFSWHRSSRTGSSWTGVSPSFWSWFLLASPPPATLSAAGSYPFLFLE